MLHWSSPLVRFPASVTGCETGPLNHVTFQDRSSKLLLMMAVELPKSHEMATHVLSDILVGIGQQLCRSTIFCRNSSPRASIYPAFEARLEKTFEQAFDGHIRLRRPIFLILGISTLDLPITRFLRSFRPMIDAETRFMRSSDSCAASRCFSVDTRILRIAWTVSRSSE